MLNFTSDERGDCRITPLCFLFRHFYKTNVSRPSTEHHRCAAEQFQKLRLSSLSWKLKGTLEHGISQEFQFVDRT